MRTVCCPYCGRQAEYVDSKIIYGRSYGMVYYCKPCGAYVGVHKGSDKPLGQLANAELRRWRNAAHAAFDPLWQRGRFRRTAAYAWLSDQMGLPADKTHIAMFDVQECQAVIRLAKEEMKGVYKNGKHGKRGNKKPGNAGRRV